MLALRLHRATSYLFRPSMVKPASHQSELRGLDVSPPICRVAAGTNSIDRDAFRKKITILAARIPAAKTGTVLKDDALKRYILDLPKIRSVVPDDGKHDNDSGRLVLLGVQSADELPAETAYFLEQEGATLTKHDIDLDYGYWTADEILQAVLPEELCEESPTGFAATGHLAHFNLNDEYLPFKNIIGQVVLDKNKKITTVVNKIGNIHSQFRFFEMELIAGAPDFIVEHRESDCRFTFDFREVYWNSRLHTEHLRLVQLFKPEEGVVADVFAGVGPFAVPAAKKGCAVIANDLNPNSVKWLQKNATDNNVAGNLRVYCEDGKDFIRAVFNRVFDQPFSPYMGPKASKRQMEEKRKQRLAQDRNVADGPASAHKARNRVAHLVMNLPETSIEFLEALRGVFSTPERALGGINDLLPMVHCHCFTRYLDPREAEADIRKRVENALGCCLEGEVFLHHVRSVAPNKDMYCISFRLPRQAAFD